MLTIMAFLLSLYYPDDIFVFFESVLFQPSSLSICIVTGYLEASSNLTTAVWEFNGV